MDDSSSEWTEVGQRRRRQVSPSDDRNSSRGQWDQQQSKAIAEWFARNDRFHLASPPDETKVLSIDPASYQGQMLVILQDLFDSVTGAASAASRMLSLIFSGNEATERFEWMVGLIVVKAATCADSEKSLSAMAELLVHIAKSPRSLPHAVNWHRNDDTGLKNMPGFGVTFTESMQGPRQYLCDFRDIDMTPDIWLTARERWRNISLFGAFVTNEYFSRALPVEMNLTFRALTTLTEALEHSTEERKTYNAGHESAQTVQHIAWLELPAAVNWIRVAGNAIYELSVRQDQYSNLPAGPLWASTGGSGEVTPARWAHWQRRFCELAEWDVIEDALKEGCERASERMNTIVN